MGQVSRSRRSRWGLLKTAGPIEKNQQEGDMKSLLPKKLGQQATKNEGCVKAQFLYPSSGEN